jgi:hypothetical protein
MAEGCVMPIQTCWDLARKWYAGRLERDWQRPGQAQAQQLFDKLGLKGAFWDLGGKG